MALTIAGGSSSTAGADDPEVTQDLVVTHNAVGSFDRTYLWDIEKEAAATEVATDPETGIATVDYTVTATPMLPPNGWSDSDWELSGVISVSNPNQSTAIVASVLSNSPGATCTVTGGTSVAVAAGVTVELAYSCAFAEQPSYDGTTIATVTWDDSYGTPSTVAAHEATYSQSGWAITDRDALVEVIDDKTDPANSVSLGSATWNSMGTPTVFTYSLDLFADSETCAIFTNTAWIDGTQQEAVETVKVCEGVAQPQNLVVTHSVLASMERTYGWSIDKVADERWPQADPVSGRAAAGYTVTATPSSGWSDGAWEISGEMSVTNPNGSTVMVATGVTNNTPGASCSMPGSAFLSLGAGSTATRPYSCVFSTQPSYNGTTTATVRRVSGYQTPDDTVSHRVSYSDLDWSIAQINEVVEVVDDQTDPANPVVLGRATWNATGTPSVFEYQLELEGTQDSCTTFTNTAWIAETQQESKETVQVCRGAAQLVDLVVDHNVLPAMERTYLWDIDKVADATEVHADPETGIATVGYTVTATPIGWIDEWMASGTISVQNPNQWTAIVATVSVSGSGSTCSVPGGASVTIGAGSTRNMPYTCVFPGEQAGPGNTTVMVTWDGAYGTPSTEVSGGASYIALDWSARSINGVVEVVDDQTDPVNSVLLGAASWLLSGEPTVFTYSLALYVDEGRCDHFTNTAWIDGTQQEAKQTVEVCWGVERPQDLVVSHTVLASLDRTYSWSIDKAANETTIGADPVRGAAAFDYTVTATPSSDWSDRAWELSGIISVTNPNQSMAMVASVSSNGPGATCTVPGGASVLIGAGATVDLAYTCAFAVQPSYDGANIAGVSWDGSYGTPSTAVSHEALYTQSEWSITQDNSVVDVFDDQTDPANPVMLGTAPWNTAGTPTEFTYALEHEGIPGSCTDFTNTAWIAQTQQHAQEIVQLCLGSLRHEKVAKSVLRLPDGNWTISYEIEVFNDSEYPAAYDLTDTLNFGAGLTAVVATWSLEGTDQTGTWNDPAVTTTASLADGRVLGGSESHRYFVTAITEVPEAVIGTDPALCSGVGGADGGGFLNVAALVAPGVSASAAACLAPQLDPVDPGPTDPSDPDPITPEPGPVPEPGPDTTVPGPGPNPEPTTPDPLDPPEPGSPSVSDGDGESGQTLSDSGRSLPRTGDDFTALMGIACVLVAAGATLAVGFSRRSRI